jgi:hypothetical protein
MCSVATSVHAVRKYFDWVTDAITILKINTQKYVTLTA